ncbi:methyltransferase domain-containing protein [Campylobacter jejuni]|nr:methyltransferase domain-containing protein [Campylobacter jejuni]TWO14650.1 class I SAM-dependent methyltransferase [Campylobacter sp. 2014D-0259]EAH9149244.1 methyltransferase domain-containing protein [Campylobacter jejuni]EAH9243545.1 methyltransferase domain-containing protein [Campylobacter jejuni]EAI7042162.1 class I SAM-dependent methyltransferase [Campylobacter jejuni]
MVYYRRKKVLEILNKYNPKNILEIGCGMDSIFNYYKNFNKAIIIEPSDAFYNKAISDFKEKDNIEIFNDFLENITKTLKNNNFDFIICSSLLHEVNNPDSFLKDILKICIKETIIHINVPNSNSFHLLWAYESGLINKLGNLTNTAIKFQQNTTFDLNKLTQFVKNHIGGGGCILDSGSYFIKPFNHSKMSLCLENKIIDEKLLDGLYKLNDYMHEFGAEIFVNIRI